MGELEQSTYRYIAAFAVLFRVYDMGINSKVVAFLRLTACKRRSIMLKSLGIFHEFLTWRRFIALWYFFFLSLLYGTCIDSTCHENGHKESWKIHGERPASRLGLSRLKKRKKSERNRAEIYTNVMYVQQDNKFEGKPLYLYLGQAAFLLAESPSM